MGLDRARLARLFRLFVLVNAIGIGVALGVWLYGQQIQAISSLRLQLSQSLPRLLVLPVMGLGAGAIAGALISGVEPSAGGSGIVQVLLYLRATRHPHGLAGGPGETAGQWYCHRRRAAGGARGALDPDRRLRGQGDR
jgi:CIC family chloride channel protein